MSTDTPSAPEVPVVNPPPTQPDFTPDRIVAELSAVPAVQPVPVLAAADLCPAELTEPFLQAIERGLADPNNSFAKEGMLFNYATYFLAKWRERRAYPLFIRWFSMPGEGAFDLGGDTLTQHGARLLASVSGGEIGPIKTLILNPEANEACRCQAVRALAVLAAWGETPRPAVEESFLFLAREGLERKPGSLWKELAGAAVDVEALSVFPELRRAGDEGLIDKAIIGSEILDAVEHAPRGQSVQRFVERHPRITDVVAETRWWAGFHDQGAPLELAGAGGAARPGQSGEPYIAPPRVGRNDPCPCGSGKKFKKCCGKSA